MAILSGVFEPENSEQMQILHQAEMSSHHAKSVYTSCFGRVHLSSILCSLWLVHYPGNRQWNRLSYWRTSPHWQKKTYIHPPQTPDLLCLPLNLVSTRLEQENLKSSNYTSWRGNEIWKTCRCREHHGHLNESECPKDPSSALSAQLR